MNYAIEIRELIEHLLDPENSYNQMNLHQKLLEFKEKENPQRAEMIENITNDFFSRNTYYYIQSKDHFCGRKFDFRDENGGGHTPDYNFWCMLYEDSERQMNCIEDTRLLQQNLPLLTESSLSS